LSHPGPLGKCKSIPTKPYDGSPASSKSNIPPKQFYASYNSETIPSIYLQQITAHREKLAGYHINIDQHSLPTVYISFDILMNVLEQMLHKSYIGIYFEENPSSHLIKLNR